MANLQHDSMGSSFVILILCAGVLAACGSLPMPTATPTPAAPTAAPTEPRPTATPAWADLSLFTGRPCAPPCWEGLTPGVSTQADAERVVESLVEGHQYTLQVRQSYFGHALYRWRGCRNGWCNPDIWVQGGYVTLITVGVLHYPGPSGVPSAGVLAERLGPPESVAAGFDCGPDGSCASGEELYYPSRGLAFELEADDSTGGKVMGPEPVWLVSFYAPGDVRNYFRAKATGSPAAEAEMFAEQGAADVHPWVGFGKNEVKVFTRYHPATSPTPVRTP